MKLNRTDQLIDGVEVKELKIIQTFDKNKTNNGWLIDILRATDTIKKDGDKFAQLYVTTAYPGMIKGFHWTKKKTYLFFCASSLAKLVIIDDRPNSPTHGYVNEILMGEGNYKVVRIPSSVKRAFKNIGDKLLLMFNCVDVAYSPQDPDILDWDSDYDWSK